MDNTFNSQGIVTNIPELTVSALSAAIKSTVEDAFGYVRVKGELSKVTIAKSGHLYTSIKDDTAVIDGVCWRGTVSRLNIKPEEGLEVICTGRITTYPGRSSYQIVIENMEMAGIGAILKMLEALKQKLAAEGIFAPENKKPIPFLPRKIGVITSPTGAVIRDILHRITDRFPTHVTLWPVNVQGQTAATEVIRAIQGFNAMEGDARPDVIIVARGGGSFEDLMPFNEESLVRAAANSQIPLISAIGHETDTTLIDYAADLRAPTPTAAAEMALPVRESLLSQVLDCGQRLHQSLINQLSNAKIRLDTYTHTLARPSRMLEMPTQKLDHAALQLSHGFERNLQTKQTRLFEASSKLRTPTEILETKTLTLKALSDRLTRTPERLIEQSTQKLSQSTTALGHSFDKYLQTKQTHFMGQSAQLRTPTQIIERKSLNLESLTSRLTRMPEQIFIPHEKNLAALNRILESLSFKSVLARGYAVIHDENGHVISKISALMPDQPITLRLHDGERKARITG